MSARYLAGFHAVREALRAGTPLRFVALSRERHDGRTVEISALAAQAGVPVRLEPASRLALWAGGEHHQGVVAEAEAKPVLALEELLARAKTHLIVALDGVEDPHNLGAIIRTAAAAGVDGVVLPARRAAGLTPTVERAASGALAHVAVARVTNLVQSLESCKKAGWWIAGLDAAGETPLWRHDFTPATVLVIGGEGQGLHELTRKRCDARLSIPLAPGVESLNASVAAGIALFEVVRQRFAGAKPQRG